MREPKHKYQSGRSDHRGLEPASRRASCAHLFLTLRPGAAPRRRPASRRQRSCSYGFSRASHPFFMAEGRPWPGKAPPDASEPVPAWIRREQSSSHCCGGEVPSMRGIPALVRPPFGLHLIKVLFLGYQG